MCLCFPDDAPIVVPKRGRSTKVTVSSVLIWDDARIWMLFNTGNNILIGFGRESQCHQQPILEQYEKSNLWLDYLHNMEFYSNLLCLYFFVYILNTNIDLGTLWTNKKNQEHLTWKSCVSSTVLASVQRSPVGGQSGKHMGHGKKLYVGMFLYLWLKLIELCFTF